MRHVGACRWLRAYAAAALLAAALAAQGAEWSGQLGAVAAQRLTDGAATELGIEARLKYAHDFGNAADAWSVRMDLRARTNSRACSQPVAPSACSARRHDADFRELHAARQFGGWRATLGWQQAVWGRADNLRVLDLVNPIDLRDFVLPDLNDYRRSVPMVKLNGTAGDWNVEAVYLPVFTPNRYPRRGAEFYFAEAEQFAAQGITLLPERRPPRKLRYGELGLLLSRSAHQVDWSLMALSTFNDDPVYRLDLRDTGSGPVPVAQPEYRRYAVLGASMAVNLAGGWVTRGEATWSPDAPYSASAAPDGIERARTFTGLLGLDYAWRDWVFSAQATDRWIHGWRSDFLLPRRAATPTLSATGTSLSAKLATRIAYTWMPQRGDGSWLQLKFTYKPDDAWAIETSLDLLDGKPGGFFGQFRDRDRARLELRRLF